MLQLDTLTICNFLSVGAITQVVNLTSYGVTLILGENLDIDEEESRNGVGKSTILQAISYALYGESLTGIRKDNLVNAVNQTRMLVTITGSRNGQPFRIERGRKPNVLRYFSKDLTVDRASGESKHTQIEIDRLIGMSHVMFTHILALNTFTVPFLMLRPAEQRSIIEELLGITQISQMADALKETMDETKEVVRNETARIAATRESNARVEQAIAGAKIEADHWVRRQETLIADLERQLAFLSEIDFEAELRKFDDIEAWQQAKRTMDDKQEIASQRCAQLMSTVERMERELSRYESASVAPEASALLHLRTQHGRMHTELAMGIDQQAIRRMTDNVSSFDEEISHLTDYISSVETKLVELRTQRENPDAHHCEVCGQGLSGTDHLATVLNNLDRMISNHETSIITARETINKRTTQIAQENEKLAKFHAEYENRQIALREQIAETEREIDQLMADADRERAAARVHTIALRQEIGVMNVDLDAIAQELIALEAETTTLGERPISRYRDRAEIIGIQHMRQNLDQQCRSARQAENPHVSKVAALSATLGTIDVAILDEANLQLKHEQFLYKLLTDKNSFVRKRIIERNLPFLNQRLNFYLETLKLPHEVLFQPDLSVEIRLLGLEYDFQQLSRGEMNRVILASSWSFRDLWESLNSGINLMLIDEVLDLGTDQAGRAAAVEILSKMASDRKKNVFLISHHKSLTAQIDNVLVVRKNNQFTSFGQDSADVEVAA